MNKTSDKKSIYKKVLGLIKPYSFMVILSIIFALINVACALYVPILIGVAIDNIISKGQVDFDVVISKLITVAIVVVIGAIAQYVLSILSNKLSYSIVKDIRVQAFSKIWKLPLNYLDTHSHGDIIARIITDADQAADGMLLGFTQFFTGLATIIGTLIFMFSLNVYITLVVIVVTPLSFFVAKYISSHTFTYFVEQSSIRGSQTSQIEETLGAVKVLRAYGGEEDKKAEFNETNEKLEKASLLALFYSSLTNPSTRFVNSLVYALVAMFGALTVLTGGMTVGVLSSFLSYANQYTKPFNEITGVITELQASLACMSRIFEILEAEEEVSDDLYEGIFTNVEGNIDINNIDFSYVPEKPLIENFNLHVKKGQKVAIVGPTGCGKTTFINLLMRFYDPIKGSINLDGSNILTSKRASLRKSFGMVLQETWLKEGTIADNIRLGKPDATMEEIIEAAKQTHAHSFIRKLEKGYDTYVTEDGGMLSAGQKQLLCITRIMLSRPPMLILDEATSSIDTRTEIKIQNAFYKLMENKTSFIVAHRLSTIINSDIILVMKEGKIIEQGTHEELLAMNGFYTNLYKAGTQVE